MSNVCPECGEYTICATCQHLFDEEAWIMALENDIEQLAMDELLRIGGEAKIDISSGEDVCLA